MEANQKSRRTYTSLKQAVRHMINLHQWYYQTVGIGMRGLLHSRDSLKMEGRGRGRAGHTSNRPHGEVVAVYILDSPCFHTVLLLLR